jgi:hypothetical protein
MGILLIEISFFIFAFIAFFSLFDFELLQKILSKNTYTSITQLPDVLHEALANLIVYFICINSFHTSHSQVFKFRYRLFSKTIFLQEPFLKRPNVSMPRLPQHKAPGE